MTRRVLYIEGPDAFSTFDHTFFVDEDEPVAWEDLLADDQYIVEQESDGGVTTYEFFDEGNKPILIATEIAPIRMTRQKLQRVNRSESSLNRAKAKIVAAVLYLLTELSEQF